MLSQQQVRAWIPHTWPLFFGRHGRFTPIQQQAIPPILDGRHALLIAATASGKTEAVLAPILERLWPNLQSPNLPISILYICPTRALVRDLYERLQPLLADTAVTLALKTGDTGPIKTGQEPAILLTTPESTDALLTRNPKLFGHLQAIILDEIHLFDNTPRGDHLRCLLARIEVIRQYARPGTEPAQRVALSATVPDPEGVAARYLQDGVIVNVPGGREIEAEIRPLYDLAELVAALAQRPAYKSLLFCNSREEVEATAVYLRQHLPHHADVFVHYSNLDAAVRREVEERFAAAAVAVCVCTSTLELGIDIGSVDDVILLGAPPDVNSFLQRIGRGGRRTSHSRVLCMPKSPGEWARFEALLGVASGKWQVASKDLQPATCHLPPNEIEDVINYSFRPSVLVQQTFSLLKQSPTGSIRLADLRRIAPPEVTSEQIRQIVSHLTFDGYLRSGRLGEWKPAEKLQTLIDQHEIYSNIGAEVMGVTAVDTHSGNTLAYTERPYPKGTILLFGGKPMRVSWVEKYRFGLTSAEGEMADEILRFQKSYAAIPFVVTQAVARSLAIQAGQIAVLSGETGMWLFPFWGTVWGELLAAVLIANGISAEYVNEYCLYVRQSINHLPPWEEKVVQKVAKETAVTLANRLEMGRFQRQLPANVGLTAVLRQLNLERFGQLYRATTFMPGEHLQDKLHLLAS
jgi:ATP-dependent Lhr-like helicase